MLSAARQTPNLLPNARGNEPVLRLTAAAAPPLPDPAPPTPEAELLAADPDPPSAAPLSDPPAPEPDGPHRVLRLAVLHAGAGDLAAIRDTLPSVQLVSVEESPHLIWDAASSEVITGLGDVAAHDVDLAALPAVVGKWEAVDTIRELSTRASLRLRVYPHDGTHRLGARIEVEITGLRHPWLTLLGLSGNGMVHYLYPLPGDSERVTPDGPFRLRLAVTEPFGADHVVALSAAEPLHRLNADLQRLDGRLAARPGCRPAGRRGSRGYRLMVRHPGPLYRTLRRDAMHDACNRSSFQRRPHGPALRIHTAGRFAIAPPALLAIAGLLALAGWRGAGRGTGQCLTAHRWRHRGQRRVVALADIPHEERRPLLRRFGNRAALGADGRALRGG